MLTISNQEKLLVDLFTKLLNQCIWPNHYETEFYLCVFTQASCILKWNSGNVQNKLLVCVYSMFHLEPTVSSTTLNVFFSYIFLKQPHNTESYACEELLQTEHLAGFNSRNNAMHLPQLNSLCSQNNSFNKSLYWHPQRKVSLAVLCIVQYPLFLSYIIGEEIWWHFHYFSPI